MFKQHTIDKINGWGTVFRFVTPILITIALWIMSGICKDIDEVRETTQEMAIETTRYNTNHLQHHASIEKEICERLARIEERMR